MTQFFFISTTAISLVFEIKREGVLFSTHYLFERQRALNRVFCYPSDQSSIEMNVTSFILEIFHP